MAPDRVPPGAEFVFPVTVLDGQQQYVTGTAAVHYRMNPAASYASAPLVSLGGGLFEATVPAPVPGDSLEYYLSADGSGGTTVTSPENAPVTVYEAQVGIVRNILCDNFEKDKGWTVQSVNLQSGAWVRVDPIRTTFLNEHPQLQFDNPLGTGTLCFVTGQGPPGGGPSVADVDGGPTRLVSPLMDISTGGTISFFYHFYNVGLDDSLEVFLSNDDGATWKPVAKIKHSPGLHQMEFDVADHVTPTAQMRLLFSVKDQPDGSITEAAIDDVVVEKFITGPTLWADAYSMSAAVGAVVTYTLDGGAPNAHRDYILLGSLTGTSPGYALPGGGGTFPVNWDSLTSFILNNPASTTFFGFHGQLDASGRATAVFDTQGPVTQTWLAGRLMTFAFASGKPWNFASTPVTLIVYP